jgi:hypothetical protein
MLHSVNCKLHSYKASSCYVVMFYTLVYNLIKSKLFYNVTYEPYFCAGMHADTEQATPNRPPAAVVAAAVAAGVGVAVLTVGVTKVLHPMKNR